MDEYVSYSWIIKGLSNDPKHNIHDYVISTQYEHNLWVPFYHEGTFI